jgi:CubicO group peptidase (beta-lactamase class C family)
MPAIDELDARIEARMRADAVPGLSVAAVAGDQVRWLRGFGTADLATGAPAGPGTAYLWFSMTKIVTATTVMRLAERGALDLDAPVNAYFPPFAVVRQPCGTPDSPIPTILIGSPPPGTSRWRVH